MSEKLAIKSKDTFYCPRCTKSVAFISINSIRVQLLSKQVVDAQKVDLNCGHYFLRYKNGDYWRTIPTIEDVIGCLQRQFTDEELSGVIK